MQANHKCEYPSDAFAVVNFTSEFRKTLIISIIFSLTNTLLLRGITATKWGTFRDLRFSFKIFSVFVLRRSLA